MSDEVKATPPAGTPGAKAIASPAQGNGALFWAVTGKDFGRSINWSKQGENSISARIKAKTAAAAQKMKPGH
jgi:hypothetical protein